MSKGNDKSEKIDAEFDRIETWVEGMIDTIKRKDAEIASLNDQLFHAKRANEGGML